MSEAINVTPITRVLGMELSEYEKRHPLKDTEDDKGNIVKRLTPYDYDEYTLYLANESVPTNHGSTLEYSNLYYGTKKVTDLIVLDKLYYIRGYYKNTTSFYKSYDGTTYSELITGEKGKYYVGLNTGKVYEWTGTRYQIVTSTEESNPQDTIGNAAYPNDKMYLVPRYESGIWRLNGQVNASPAGYDIYYKHDGIVTPISTSVISKVSYNYNDNTVDLTFNTNDGQKTFTIPTLENFIEYLNSLPADQLSGIANAIYSNISNLIREDPEISNTLVTKVINILSGNVSGDSRRLSIANLSDGTSTINDLKTKMGYSNIPSGSSLQSQITNLGNGTGINPTTGNSFSTKKGLDNSLFNLTQEVSGIKTNITGDVGSKGTLQSQIDSLKISTTGTGTNSLQTQINNLVTATTSTSNANSLIKRISNLEGKVGDSTDTGSGTIYGRIKSVEDKFVTLSTEGSSGSIIPDITSIKTKMGYSNIPDGSNLQSEIRGIIDDIGDDSTANTVKGRIKDLENSVGTAIVDITTLKTKVNNVGVFPNVSGRTGYFKKLYDSIGSSIPSSYDDTELRGRIESLEATVTIN